MIPYFYQKAIIISSLLLKTNNKFQGNIIKLSEWMTLRNILNFVK